jgi:thiamine biosynthesis protein ThiI
MLFIVKLFPEIFVKSPPVRKRLTRMLVSNMKRLFRDVEGAELRRDFEKIEVSVPDDQGNRARVIEILSTTPGIDQFSEAMGIQFDDLEHIAELCHAQLAEKISGKTFVVRVKRSGKQDFKSTDVERYVGGYLLHKSGAKGVDLHTPDVRIQLEIRHQDLFIIDHTWTGLGGFPLGSQEKVLSLISGGFDSSVASYLSTRRGLVTHYLFFNLGGRAHEIGVKEVAHYLWHKYSSSHPVKFITVPFEEVVTEILTNIPKSYMGVALKRMMLRAAEQVAQQYDFKALVTGEAVAQVSSQTLANLAVIDSVSGMLVMRPLSTMDKTEIIKIARDIGTEEFAASMPEYCGVISRKPTTAAKSHIIEDAETSFDFSVLDRAVAEHKVEPISRILESVIDIPVDIYDTLVPGAVLVDVRHPDEIQHHPIAETHSPNNEHLEIPYFRIQKEFDRTDAKKRYLLYCDRGVMSRLHAELLVEAGYRNVGVYRPGRS